MLSGSSLIQNLTLGLILSPIRKAAALHEYKECFFWGVSNYVRLKNLSSIKCNYLESWNQMIANGVNGDICPFRIYGLVHFFTILDSS